MRILTEPQYNKLVNNLGLIVRPKIAGKVVCRGGKLMRRELDGGLYEIQAYASNIRIFSTSQLRANLKGVGEERGEAIKNELKRRGALK